MVILLLTTLLLMGGPRLKSTKSSLTWQTLEVILAKVYLQVLSDETERVPGQPGFWRWVRLVAIVPPQSRVESE